MFVDDVKDPDKPTFGFSVHPVSPVIMYYKKMHNLNKKNGRALGKVETCRETFPKLTKLISLWQCPCSG